MFELVLVHRVMEDRVALGESKTRLYALCVCVCVLSVCMRTVVCVYKARIFKSFSRTRICRDLKSIKFKNSLSSNQHEGRFCSSENNSFSCRTSRQQALPVCVLCVCGGACV
jgi:hypothetical protein